MVVKIVEILGGLGVHIVWHIQNFTNSQFSSLGTDQRYNVLRSL